MPKLTELDTKLRILSIFHAIFQLVLAAKILIFHGKKYMPAYCGKQNSQNETFFVQNMFGYLIYDFVHKVFFGLITMKILFG